MYSGLYNIKWIESSFGKVSFSEKKTLLGTDKSLDPILEQALARGRISPVFSEQTLDKSFIFSRKTRWVSETSR